MSELPDAREILLVRLADPQDHAAWTGFVELYHPAVYRLARCRGLQPADAEDITQQVFVSVSQPSGSGIQARTEAASGPGCCESLRLTSAVQAWLLRTSDWTRAAD